MRVSISVIISVFIGASLFAQGSARRPMTVDDALSMIRIADVLMSPDGEWVFFSKSELDWDENKRKKKYYMIPAGGGEAIQFIGDAGGESFHFSPDGKYLSFIRPVDDNDQVFWMRTAGGEATKLTDDDKANCCRVGGRHRPAGGGLLCPIMPLALTGRTATDGAARRPRHHRHTPSRSPRVLR